MPDAGLDPRGRLVVGPWSTFHHWVAVYRTLFYVIEQRSILEPRSITGGAAMGSAQAIRQTAPSRTYPSLRAAAIPLFALCLAFFVEMVDNTLMSIALPTIGRDLGGGTLSLQWV